MIYVVLFCITEREDIYMEQQSFSEGIAPGGLREQTEIKLLVCYLLKSLDRPLSRAQINEILQEYPIANYFEVNQAMSDLVKSGNLICELEGEEEMMSLSARARFDVAAIENSLPRAIREKAVRAAWAVLSRERIRRESKVEVAELEQGGFHVTFTVFDVGIELMKLTVYVAERDQIERVKRNFFDHAVELYSDIIASLTVD